MDIRRLSSRWSAGRRWLPWSGAAVVVLLVISGGAAASTTLKAPFKTAKVGLANPTSQSGCGNGSVLSPASFNRTSGVGGFADNASSVWCNTSASNSALRTGKITVSIPVKVATTGHYTITAVWITVALGFVNLTAGKCAGSASVKHSTCTRSAKAYVLGTAYVQDKTVAGKTPPTTNWPGNSTSVSNTTTCAFTTCLSKATAHHSAQMSTGTAFWQWVWNGTLLNASHSYVLVMVVYGGASVVLSESGATLVGARADAHLNTATLGQDEQLYSVTIA